jgi:arylsulfatase A-like enzyme
VHWLSHLVVALLAVALLARCTGRSGAAEDPGATLGALDLIGRDGQPAPALHFSERPRVERVASGLYWRTALVTEPGTWSWDVKVPAAGRLHLGVESFARAGSRGDPPPLELTVAVVAGGDRKALYVASPREIDAPDWLDLELDLGRWSGQQVRIELSTRAVGDPDPRAAPAELAWAPMRVVAPGAPTAAVPAAAGVPATGPERPSILLIVVDTLRADYVSPYGGSSWNSPNISQGLARHGVLFENVYAQAPWTLPSMVSLLTGVVPGVLLGSQAASFGIPPEQPTLPELLSGAGYETAAFIANPTLHQGNGFGRGLDDLYISPPETAFITLEDELLVRKARTWLRARGERPFYLHVHFLAPHDPYTNPVQFLGRSPSHPFYLGRITGRDVHELFLGAIELDDPGADLPHLRALYASEVRWVDRWVGALLDAIPEERLRDTLIVLTADHGEELYEHGGWKHGRTLYEEQLRVPLVMRWDEVIAERRRVASPVRLIDVAPTLLEAAGLRAPAGSATGRSLLGELRGDGKAAPEDVYVERLNFGPTLVAVISNGKKLVVFDRNGTAPLVDAMQEERVEEEAQRQPRIALYDLQRDPREERNLVAEAPDLVRRLLPQLHRGLDRTTPGLRVLAGRLGPDARLDVTVRFAAPPTEWRSYFLASADRATLSGRELRLELTSDVIEKGVVVLGEWRAIESVEALLDGEPVDAYRIWTPASSTPPAALDTEALSGEPPSGAEASAPDAPVLYLWVPASGSTEAPAGRPDAETLHRLRALGYL